VLKYKFDWFGDGSQLAFFCKETATPLATQRHLVCRDVRVSLYRIGSQFGGEWTTAGYRNPRSSGASPSQGGRRSRDADCRIV